MKACGKTLQGAAPYVVCRASVATVQRLPGCILIGFVSACRPTARAPSTQGCPAAALSLPQGRTSAGPGPMTTAALWTGETLVAPIVTPAAAAAMGRPTQGPGAPLLGWA